jgi:hypothetical protein
MTELVLIESDTRKKIYEILESYGVTEKILIDNEAEPAILNALMAPDIESVFIDHEGALVINYAGDE